MAQIKFWGGDAGAYDLDTNGSGLAFMGSTGFGSSVAVNEFQDYTYSSNAAGTQQGPELENWKFMHTASGQYNRGTTYALSGIPNAKATLNVRFTESTAVTIQNAKLRIYDRVNVNNNPSGVTCRVAELVRPNKFFGDAFATSAPWGSGSVQWSTPVGSSIIHTMIAVSPGISGNCTRGSVADTRHDWYFLLSARPDSIGSKTFAAYVSLEYL